MIETLRHVNSRGEELDFLKLGILINYNTLRDFEWSITSAGDRISGFTRGVTNKSIPFVFHCDEERAAKIKNTFYEHFEVDILDKKAGYFEINEYRYHCFLTKSKKSNYLVTKRLLNIEVEISSDHPFWVRENKVSYNADISAEIGSKTYQYHYSYTYGKAPGNGSLTNDGMKSSDMKLIIYGPASNPSISIAGHVYSVSCEVSSNEYLVIDTMSREIYIMTIAGEKINMFEKRNFDSYIFEKVPAGYSLVAWSGGFGFDLIVYDERSEPKWI